MPKDKKRKRDAQEGKSKKEPKSVARNGHLDNEPSEVDTSKPSAVFKPTGGRSHTLSIALPGSIIANAKTHDQKTFLVGQIARALAVFCVDEIVIFDEEDVSTQQKRPAVGDDDYTAFSHPDHFMAHLLSYLETPPHLRKTLFPMHPNLRTAGTLPSLDMPHHLRAHEWCEYREGVTLKPSPDGSGTLVDVGLSEPRQIPDVAISPGTRVTLDLQSPTSKIAVAVSPSAPREEKGYYWGYTVRQCNSLSAVFTECAFDGGYDLSIGMSERGQPLVDALTQDHMASPEMLGLQHVLLVFGGVAGLEVASRNDPDLREVGTMGKNVNELFDCWVNLLPGQGSRTIRTEEAVWLGLMGLRGFIERLGHKKAGPGHI